MSNVSPPKKFKKSTEPPSEGEPSVRPPYDEETHTTLDEIDKCETDLDAINDLASNEILEIEQKYNKLRKPIYDKRQEVIAKLPQFWLTCVSLVIK